LDWWKSGRVVEFSMKGGRRASNGNRFQVSGIKEMIKEGIRN
jgi:hypothetical protein